MDAAVDQPETKIAAHTMSSEAYNALDRKILFEHEDYLSPELGYPERPVESWFKPHILPLVLEHAGQRDNILDVGCAFGYISRILAEHFSYVLAIDLAQNRVDYAKAYEQPGRLDFKQVDLVKDRLAGLSDTKFDTVYTSAVIQHIPLNDKPTAIRNIAEVTAIGGIMLMFDHRDELEIRDDFVGSYNERYWDQYPEWRLLSIEFVVGDTWFYKFQRI